MPQNPLDAHGDRVRLGSLGGTHSFPKAGGEHRSCFTLYLLLIDIRGEANGPCSDSDTRLLPLSPGRMWFYVGSVSLQGSSFSARSLPGSTCPEPTWPSSCPQAADMRPPGGGAEEPEHPLPACRHVSRAPGRARSPRPGSLPGSAAESRGGGRSRAAPSPLLLPHSVAWSRSPLSDSGGEEAGRLGALRRDPTEPPSGRLQGWVVETVLPWHASAGKWAQTGTCCSHQRKPTRAT